MEGFLHSINPRSIFHSYKGAPDAERFQTMTQQAEKNIVIAYEYLSIKLLSIAILEALAMSTGGDAPVSLFMGSIRAGDEEGIRAEDYLPPIIVASDVQHNPVLSSIFESGRTHKSS
ncbi:MAG: hypothetical protein V3R80_12070, partial [Candidatus Tectomicrobia bacterium]